MNYFYHDIPNIVKDLKGEIESLKTLLQEQKESLSETKKLLTVEEVSDFLSLSNSTIYGMVSRREIPHIKVSKRLYFDRDEIREFLKYHRKNTRFEIENSSHTFLKGGESCL